MNRKLYALLAVLVFASMVLSACGGAGQAASSKTITIAYTQEPDNVAAEYSNMTYSAWLDQVVGASLVTWDANNNLVAQLAAEVPSAANGDVSADGLTITFKVKTKPQMVRWPTADFERCTLHLAITGGSEERPHQSFRLY